MSADYEVTITVKTNVPVMAEDMTGLDAINVAMDYGLSRMLKDGEYKLVGVTVERVAIQDTDDDVENEYQDNDVEPEPEPEDIDEDEDEDEIPEPDEADDEPEDSEPENNTEDDEPEDTDGDSDYQDADDDPEPEITEVQFTEPDKGNIVIAKRTPPSSLPLPKIGG